MMIFKEPFATTGFGTAIFAVFGLCVCLRYEGGPAYLLLFPILIGICAILMLITNLLAALIGSWVSGSFIVATIVAGLLAWWLNPATMGSQSQITDALGEGYTLAIVLAWLWRGFGDVIFAARGG